MALTGLQIYKFLPRTNCKKCGFPTCLAFAMKLAQKGAELSSCPDVSEEAKAALDSASRPPIQLVTIGSGERKLAVGNETVMFRHEKTFVHQPGLLLRVRATDSAEKKDYLIDQATNYSVERVGLTLAMNGLAVDADGVDASAYADFVTSVRSKTDVPLILIAEDPAVMAAGLEKVKGDNPLIYAATATNAEEMAKLAVANKCPLAVRADGIDALAELVEQVAKAGANDIVLDPGARSFGDSLTALTQIRRLALRKNYRPMGYPVITFPGEQASSPEEEGLLAAQHITKYAGIIVLENFSAESIYPLLTLRLNIFTDPQKPIQVTPGVYPVREPGKDSPLLVTTNFSLTYFTVLGEVEGSNVPAWLLIVDSEGLSVLTGWAAGKFDAEKIAKAVKSNGLEDRVSHHKVVLPGLVATLSGELEDELSGWTVLVGPRDAVDISGYLRRWSA